MSRTLVGMAALGLAALGGSTAARAQVFERDTTVTGPRGNSVSRDVKVERFGNMVDRQVTVRRPGGTITRNTEVFAPRGGGFYGPRPFFGGGGFMVGPALIGPPLAIGVGLPAVNIFAGGGGGGFAGPGVASMPPVTVYNPPVPYPLSTAAANGAADQPATPQPQPAPGQPTVVVDPVAETIGKLTSFHAHIRREAAITLGKYGDARGVPPLIDKLEHDFDKEVRMASAWALAEIGDPRAIVPLETARQFDKRADVRSVASKSLERMPREAPAESQAPRRAQASAAGRSSEDTFGYPTQPQRRSATTGATAPRSTSSPTDPAPDLEPPQYTPSTEDIPPPDPTPSRSPR